MSEKIDMWTVLWAWLGQNAPICYAAGLAFCMAVLRIMYNGGTWRQMLIEGMICGGIAVTCSSALGFFDWPPQMAVFIGGWSGFLGVEKIRLLVNRYVGFAGNGKGGNDG